MLIFFLMGTKKHYVYFGLGHSAIHPRAPSSEHATITSWMPSSHSASPPTYCVSTGCLHLRKLMLTSIKREKICDQLNPSHLLHQASLHHQHSNHHQQLNAICSRQSTNLLTPMPVMGQAISCISPSIF